MSEKCCNPNGNFRIDVSIEIHSALENFKVVAVCIVKRIFTYNKNINMIFKFNENANETLFISILWFQKLKNKYEWNDLNEKLDTFHFHFINGLDVGMKKIECRSSHWRNTDQYVVHLNFILISVQKCDSFFFQLKIVCYFSSTVSHTEHSLFFVILPNMSDASIKIVQTFFSCFQFVQCVCVCFLNILRCSYQPFFIFYK